MDKKILLGHGSGGRLSRSLIRDLFLTWFSNRVLQAQGDSAVLPADGSHLAFTTDAFVVDPIFFPGGDIGKLAVAGTVNDLAVAGAQPVYLTASFIIEEGFAVKDLERIVQSMAEEAEQADIQIVAGDTKIVNRGKCDKIFITTSGVGWVDEPFLSVSLGTNIRPGDKIIINGPVGDHGMAILAARELHQFKTDIGSDCASLNHIIQKIKEICRDIRFMRDVTRGGLATVLAELAENRLFGVEIHESAIPVNENTRGLCELLGYDPLYVANEGKFIAVVPADSASDVLTAFKSHPLGREAAIIGNIVEQHPGHVWMNTAIGGKRMIDMLAGEQLPRIC
ncbi:MAG: hydrogenase expression/formation protein HypE [Bacteroidales bacterium]|nr:hydrogenase expression/formation protein HypE [Lentimicrobiaceae bacterium]MDD5695654.1 hydrogenase expression/formation protein HypE [Bacteroidales bacterium]